MRAATLYGSAAEFGRRSSSHPFHPLSTVAIGMRIEAPRSETPNENLSIDCVSCFPVSLLSLSAPYTSICSLMNGRNDSQIVSYVSLLPQERKTPFEKLACIPEPFQSVS